jgi:hypothetical protein
VSSEQPTEHLSGEHDAYVERTSVADLIARRLDEDDPWRLALVQRHLVWDEVRMAHLLDSLLAGYPIGSLLVCRVRQEAHVLRESGVTRVADGAILADEGGWRRRNRGPELALNSNTMPGSWRSHRFSRRG